MHERKANKLLFYFILFVEHFGKWSPLRYVIAFNNLCKHSCRQRFILLATIYFRSPCTHIFCLFLSHSLFLSRCLPPPHVSLHLACTIFLAEHPNERTWQKTSRGRIMTAETAENGWYFKPKNVIGYKTKASVIFHCKICPVESDAIGITVETTQTPDVLTVVETRLFWSAFEKSKNDQSWYTAAFTWPLSSSWGLMFRSETFFAVKLFILWGSSNFFYIVILYGGLHIGHMQQ